MEEAGFPLNKEYLSDTGLKCIDSVVQKGGEAQTVTITFSAGHPFMSPTVTSTEPLLERHQRPRQENFCLDREDDPWWTPKHTAADMLAHLQGLLEADDGGALERDEADMPEPVSRQLPYGDSEIVVVPEPLLENSLPHRSGTLELTRNRDNSRLWLAGAETKAGQERDLVSAGDLPRLGLDKKLQRVRVEWSNVDLANGRPGVLGAERAIRERLSEAAQGVLQGRTGKANKREVRAAITFLEEGPRRGERQRAWVFARATVPTAGRAPMPQMELSASQALSRPTRQLRLQKLRGLESRSALLVGAGSVGGHMAMELARADIGHLHIVDDDYYDINNGVRHVLPSRAAGQSKADAVAALAREASPFSKIDGHNLKLGESIYTQEKLTDFLAEADVVVDAGGSRTLTRLLHWHCAETGLPLISGALSPGGLGARIVVLREFRPCLDCFYADREIPVPASEIVSNTTPYGCSHPAASCAPFDAAELATNMARVAVRALPRLPYPRLDFDWAVINFTDSRRRWTEGFLDPQADCPVCGE